MEFGCSGAGIAPRSFGGLLMFGKLRCAAFGVIALSSSLLVSTAARATDLSNSIAGSVSDGTASIPYRLFEPQNAQPGQKLPLVLFLHGMGERGTNNVTQTNWAANLVSHTSGGQDAAYVLA